MAAPEKTGLWGQFLLFMGMSYPGRAGHTRPEPAPECPNCGNPTRRGEDGRFACPHHPFAQIEQPGADAVS
jgi:hypothetical protein